MILSPASIGATAWTLATLALLAYLLAALPERWTIRAGTPCLWGAVTAHAALLSVELGATGAGQAAVRLGFGPVLSLTVCLILVVHAVESRFVQLPSVRRVLSIAGASAVALALAFPGEVRVLGSPWAPVHWVLGVAAYGLLGASFLHALLLDGAERRMRLRSAPDAQAWGVPLLQLERLTFAFVKAGFAVLTLAMGLGMLTAPSWRWDHKTVLSMVGWALIAALLAGRHWGGWRGRQATRWIYAGVGVLLLAYAGSRFVLEVVLGRAVG